MKPLHVPGVVDSLELISNYVLVAAEMAALPEPDTHRLRLAVGEIATNICVHGYDEANLSGNIIIQAEISVSRVTITLKDTAVPYDPRLRPPPEDLHKPIEERQIGGLGVYLTMESVDEFDYHYADGMNHNIITIRRRPATFPCQ